jgi:hypothetical protein
MNDMSSVIVPRSDQVNADDFLGGPMTFTIKGVDIKGGTEQPVSISLVETDKFYRPCKSMSRVLVANWGPDAKAYIGRSLTLYRDPDVQWGHIEAPVTLALTATRANRKPFTVHPLVRQRPAAVDAASKWADAYVAKLATLTTVEAVRAFEAEKAAKLAELKTKRADLYQSIVGAVASRIGELSDDFSAADDFNSPPAPQPGTPTAEAGPSNGTEEVAAFVPEGPDDSQRGDGDSDAMARAFVDQYITAVREAKDKAALEKAYADGDENAATIRRDFPDLYAEIDPFRPADAPEKAGGLFQGGE